MRKSRLFRGSRPWHRFCSVFVVDADVKGEQSMNHGLLVAGIAAAAALLGSAITGLWTWLVTRDHKEHHNSRRDTLGPASFRWRIVLFRAQYLAKREGQ